MKNKKMLLIAVGLMLPVVITGCAVAEKGLDAASRVKANKDELCSKLPDKLQKLGAAIIHAKVEAYPNGGLCDPELLRKEAKKRLNDLQQNVTEK